MNKDKLNLDAVKEMRALMSNFTVTDKVLVTDGFQCAFVEKKVAEKMEASKHKEQSLCASDHRTKKGGKLGGKKLRRVNGMSPMQQLNKAMKEYKGSDKGKIMWELPKHKETVFEGKDGGFCKVIINANGTMSIYLEDGNGHHTTVEDVKVNKLWL